jgi:superfamily II DNA or RNA helicase
MSGWLSEEDRALAIAILRQRLSAHQLRQAVDRDVERLVATAERVRGLYRSRIDDNDLAAFLVDSRGVGLLEGAGDGRELRRALAQTLDDIALDLLIAHQPGAYGSWSRAARVREVAQRNWHPGKAWPHCFVRAIGLPDAFAGVVGIPEGPAIDDIDPYVPLPPLHDFQEELKQRLLEVLNAAPGANRGLLSLPTGAGKTLTAVEALSEWWADDDVDRGFVLWIAQSEELCEQAVQAFREVWIDRGWKCHERRTLRLNRVWGNRSVPDTPGGIVVASIQKLYQAMGSSSAGVQASFAALAEMTRAVVVDEAHHATAPQYLAVLRRFGIAFGDREESRAPLIGLTATPYRGAGAEENQRLARYFSKNLLIPAGMEDPIGELRGRGILSEVKHTSMETGRRFALSTTEEQQFERFGRLPDSFVRKVGGDAARNRMILNLLLKLDRASPTLFFGCSIDHAIATAVLLRRNGRTAAAVSADTRRATRRYLIEQFRQGWLQFLCNFGVLTTGFDAPKVEAVVIARPTDSPVLYEQMIGRGMRGPANGGTTDCMVIDLVDHIDRFRGQMAYTRYSEYWQ